MEPSIVTVIVTGLVLVFAILILLYLIIIVQGVIFVGIDKKKNAKAQSVKVESASAANPAPASAAPAPAPAVQAGIPGEVVAAISAAVTATSDGPVALRSIAKAPARRNGWGLAAVYSYTEPF